jgi:molybdate transport repressor ModE-like protein
MDARQLEVFRAIMREGSLTAAANTLGISQPAVSKKLQHLEDQLGYALFERSGGRLLVTAEARLLYDDADRVFRELEVLTDLARRVGERKTGLLRIGAALPVVHSVLPRALRNFRETHGDVRIHLHSYPAREVTEALRAGDIDLGLTLSPMSAPTVRSQVLADIPVKVLLRKGDALTAKTEITPEDLAQAPLISYGSHAEIGLRLDTVFRQAGCVRTVSIQVASSAAAAPLVAEGLGPALVDGLSQYGPDIVVRPFVPLTDMQLIASFDSSRPLGRLVPPFMSALKNIL